MCRIVYLLLICSFLWVFINGWTIDEYEDKDNDDDEIYEYYRYGEYCGKNSFKCESNYKCIPKSKQCDNIADCFDKSDERNCDDPPLETYTVTCANDEFSCKNKKECIPERKFCDNVTDCTDNSDEFSDCQKQLNCTDKFRCNNGFCVRNEWVCDGTKDCTDNSDEMNCENKITESECNNANNRYLCKNKRCVSLDVVCDSKDNCGDKSDEGGNCTNSILCSSVKCQYCKSTPTGPVCFCPSGYKLQNNNTCIDIDECQTYGICDQGCKNLPGSYECFCHSDYTLQDDKKTCKADGKAVLLFSTRKSIVGRYLDSLILLFLEKNLDHATDFDKNRNYLYWSEVKNNENSVIKRRNIYTSEKPEAIVTGGLDKVTSLAVDWITGNVYFTDSGYSRIGVCNDKGTHCTVLIDMSHYIDIKPKLLVLLPAKGLMYYYEEIVLDHIGDIHFNKAIQMAEMDGKNIETLIRPNSIVNGLAIDYPNNRLYWLSKDGTIESVKLDGTDKRSILNSIVGHASSLAIFENKLYWSNSESKLIQSCDKFSGKDFTTITHTMDETYHIHIEYEEINYNVLNPCRMNPCSQLCLLSRNESYTCACSMDKKLDTDGHTCLDTEMQHYVIIVGNTLINYYHNLIGKSKVTTSTFSNYITKAVYDQLTGTILAVDQSKHYVIRYDPKNGDITNLISIKNMIVGGMAFDYIGNNVYLSNIERKSIEVHSLTTKEKTIFYFDEEPYSIETVPTQGIMYVVFDSKIYFMTQTLYEINMNGLEKRNSVSYMHFKNPSDVLLHYDSKLSTLFTNFEFEFDIRSYFSPSTLKTVTKLSTIKLTSMLPELTPVSFDVSEDDIFWIDKRDSKQLYRTNINWDKFHQHIALTMPIDKVEKPLVIYLRGIVVHKKEGCLQNNGNCSHVCLPSSLQSFICACPPKMVLDADNRTCIAPTKCPSHEIRCSEHDICIKNEQWCDGHDDCPNGEDEENNCNERGICEENEFMCKDRACINATKRCDLHFDCVDKSDEQNCSQKTCRKGEYKCRNGTCISHFLVCDGNNDCSDFSDELYCDAHTCASDEFKCNMGKCIPEDWKCDDEFDCPDGSDEHEHCYLKSVCGPNYYECTNGRCISTLLKCNGLNDCGDNSDEKYCKSNRNCTNDEYQCINSDICVPKKAKCNGIQDCPRNDDEYHCTYCLEKEFVCDNQKCISEKWVCDKMDDCGDKSDEKDCDNNKKNFEDCKQFKCTDGTCLPFDRVCNNMKDCPDGSDEYGNCSKACENAKCKDLCHNRPHGPVCDCRSGYYLDSDGISCNDINECQQNVCSQKCVNTVGSYECSCIDGYSLRADKMSCKAIGPQMQFITATDKDIRMISANVQFIELVHQLMGLSISSIDSNALENAVYWSSEEEGTINKINITTQEILTIGNLTPGAIAVDWITNNIYFSDSQQFDKNRPNVIKVCNLEQLKCAVVVEIKDTAKITALAVNPLMGYLFWSQTIWHRHDKPIAEIYRTDMMGADMKKIVFGNISVISGIAIDPINSNLYWSDSHLKIIESSTNDGSARSTFLNTDKYQPASINIFEDSIYWLMVSTGRLQKCKLYSNNACITIDIGALNIHKHFTIFHRPKHYFFVEKFCEKQNCDYMCVLTHTKGSIDNLYNTRTACICQDGKPIEPNTTCPKNEEITFASRTSTHTCCGNGICSTIIVVILVVGTLLGVYYFYQKYKLKLHVLDFNVFESIRFQNPLFERRDEVAVTLNSVASSSTSPGQHEYMNPITDY